jgi:hypothetical protein
LALAKCKRAKAKGGTMVICAVLLAAVILMAVTQQVAPGAAVDDVTARAAGDPAGCSDHHGLRLRAGTKC